MKDNSISKNIKHLRKEKGLTQTQLAHLTGLSMSAIRSYENGLREPNSKAMAALESYFHVTGEYLRGEIDSSESRYIWQDKEIMDATNESFPVLINKLLDSVLHNTEIEQKMLFDIFLELYHISSQKNCSPEFKQAAFILMQDIAVNTTRYIDFCKQLPNSDLEKERLSKLRSAYVDNYRKALSDFEKKIF